MDVKEIIYKFLHKLVKEKLANKEPKDLVFYNKGRGLIKRKINITYANEPNQYNNKSGKKFSIDVDHYLLVSNWTYDDIYKNPFSIFTGNIPTVDLLLYIQSGREYIVYDNNKYNIPSTRFIEKIELTYPDNNNYIIINLEISNVNDESHQNVIILEKKNSQKNLYHYESHNINSNFVTLYTPVYKAFIEEKFREKGYNIIPEQKICPIGIQNFTQDPTGWCILYSQLWLFTVLHILSKNVNSFIHEWIENVEKYLIQFAIDKYTDKKDIYSLYILFFLEIDYLIRSKNTKMFKVKTNSPPPNILNNIYIKEQNLLRYLVYQNDIKTYIIPNDKFFIVNSLHKDILVLCNSLKEPYKTNYIFNQYFFYYAMVNNFLLSPIDMKIKVGKDKNCDDEKIFCADNLYCDYETNKCKEYKDDEIKDSIVCEEDKDCDYGICDQNRCRLSNMNERCRNSEDCVPEETGFFHWLKSFIIPDDAERKIYCIKDDDDEEGKCQYLEENNPLKYRARNIE